MWFIFAIVLIAIFIGVTIVIPWTKVEENVSAGNWKRALWIILCAISFLCYWFTGLQWVSYLTVAIILIGLFVEKRR